jgi:hypothetical protein
LDGSLTSINSLAFTSWINMNHYRMSAVVDNTRNVVYYTLTYSWNRVFIIGIDISGSNFVLKYYKMFD